MDYSDDFLKMLKLLIGYEGSISNDKEDPGGFTFYGISRKRNPDWVGWKYISKGDLKTARKLVPLFYYDRYYKKLSLDKYEDILSFENKYLIFDTGVNIGILRAKKFFQMTLNTLDLYGEPLKVDGIIGKKSLRKLFKVYNFYSGKYGTKSFYDRFQKIYLGYRIKYYLNLISERPVLKKYIYGWLNRAYSLLSLSV